MNTRVWRKFIIFATVSSCREPCRFGIMARCRRRACNIINKNTHSMKQKRLLFLSLLTAATMATAQTGRPAAAPTWTEWHNLEINEVNRLPLHTEFFAFNGTGQLGTQRLWRPALCEHRLRMARTLQRSAARGACARQSRGVLPPYHHRARRLDARQTSDCPLRERHFQHLPLRQRTLCRLCRRLQGGGRV